MSAAAGPVDIPFNLIVGPILIGVTVNAFVFGVCFLQFIEYLSAGYKDNWKLVALLFWVIAIDVFETGALIQLMWHYVVDNFANVQALFASPWTYATVPIFNTLASVPIQHFMAWRIMRFSKKIWLFIIVSILSLTQGALACASATMGLLSPDIASHVKIIPVADAWLATSVACDVLITVLLLYYLNKSRTGFKRTDSIIFRISRITVEAALPVALLCILDLVFLTTFPNYNLHFMCAIPVGRLYTNTLLTTLNARESLRKTMESSGAANSYQLSSRGGRTGVRGTEVMINVEQQMSVDMKSVPHFTSNGSDDLYPAPSMESKASLA